jgi:hypothetical protein
MYAQFYFALLTSRFPFITLSYIASAYSITNQCPKLNLLFFSLKIYILCHSCLSFPYGENGAHVGSSISYHLYTFYISHQFSPKSCPIFVPALFLLPSSTPLSHIYATKSLLSNSILTSSRASLMHRSVSASSHFNIVWLLIGLSRYCLQTITCVP